MSDRINLTLSNKKRRKATDKAVKAFVINRAREDSDVKVVFDRSSRDVEKVVVMLKSAVLPVVKKKKVK